MNSSPNESWAVRRRDSNRISPRPINLAFYRAMRKGLARTRPARSKVLDALEGVALDLEAGQVMSLTLLEAPQIVNVFAFNKEDYFERVWHQTIVSEGPYLTRFSRVWGTMPRCRPLLTVIDDTVTSRQDGPYSGGHHPILGGSGTPAAWHFANGRAGVATTWEQFAAILLRRRIPLHLLGDNICIFQQSMLEPRSQRFRMCPSEAMTGDKVSLFAEMDLCVLLALSPYLDGARSPAALGVPTPRPVRLDVFNRIGVPLGWPYPGVPYPDLRRYLDADDGVPPSVATERCSAGAHQFDQIGDSSASAPKPPLS